MEILNLSSIKLTISIKQKMISWYLIRNWWILLGIILLLSHSNKSLELKKRLWMLWKLWHLSYNYKSMSLSLSSKWNNCAISPMIPMMTGSFSLFLVMIPPTTPPSSLIYETKKFLKTFHAMKSVNSFVMLYITPSYLMTYKERS